MGRVHCGSPENTELSSNDPLGPCLYFERLHPVNFQSNFSYPPWQLANWPAHLGETFGAGKLASSWGANCQHILGATLGGKLASMRGRGSNYTISQKRTQMSPKAVSTPGPIHIVHMTTLPPCKCPHPLSIAPSPRIVAIGPGRRRGVYAISYCTYDLGYPKYT